MLVPNRHASSNSYRYGFQGQEKDDEIKGEGNTYTAEFWHYDSRTGRRYNVDPLIAKYPYFSSYLTFHGNPIYFVDPSGLEGEGWGKRSSDGVWEYNSDINENNYKQSGNYSDYKPDGSIILAHLAGTDGKIIEGTYKQYLLSSSGKAINVKDAQEIDSFGDTLENIRKKQEVKNTLDSFGAIVLSPAAQTVFTPALIDFFAMTSVIAIPLTFVGDEPIEKEDPNVITLYRGVYVGHPDYLNAVQGKAAPIGGNATPKEHNEGNNNSIYTSWSVYRSVADKFGGRKGPGGIVLIKQFKLNEIVPSPDKFQQGEILVPGIVTGAIPLPATPNSKK